MSDRDPAELADVVNRVKAIAFDAVGTVMYAEPSVSQAYCHLLEQSCGVAVDPGRVRAVLKARLGERTDTENLRTSEELERVFWFDLISELVDDPSQRQSAFVHLFAHFARPESWRCFADVAATLETLKRPGKTLLLASNFDLRLHRVKAGLEPLAIIDQVIVSSEVGWRKPSRHFFDAVCQSSGCNPEEVLFVGDDRTADVEGSLQFGMHAVWVNRDGVQSEMPSCPQNAFEIRQLAELCGQQ
jgi:putative hydrolase of the HAD superfamily